MNFHITTFSWHRTFGIVREVVGIMFWAGRCHCVQKLNKATWAWPRSDTLYGRRRRYAVWRRYVVWPAQLIRCMAADAARVANVVRARSAAEIDPCGVPLSGAEAPGDAAVGMLIVAIWILTSVWFCAMLVT